MPEPRRCKDCGQTYPATREFFWYRPQNRLGLDTACKYCRNAEVRRQYKRDAAFRETRLASSRRWYAAPQNRQYSIVKATNWRRANPRRASAIQHRARKRWALRKVLRARGMRSK